MKCGILEDKMKVLEDAALEKALKQYNDLVQLYEIKGINKIGERVIAIEDNIFKSYSGNYNYYKNIKD